MSALAFDPWAALKCKAGDAIPANAANHANPIPESTHRLAALAGLAGVPSSLPKTTSQPETPPATAEPDPDDAGHDTPQPLIVSVQGLPSAEWVEAMAEALAANPVYTIANHHTAMVYFRGRALAMWDATPDPYARGLMLGFERHRHALVVHSKPTGR
jgi:hypothetical protein